MIVLIFDLISVVYILQGLVLVNIVSLSHKVRLLERKLPRTEIGYGKYNVFKNNKFSTSASHQLSRTEPRREHSQYG